MEEIKIPLTSVFVSLELVQHANSDWRTEQVFWYHSYLAPETHYQPDSVAFFHEESTLYGLEKAVVSSKTGLD